MLHRRRASLADEEQPVARPGRPISLVVRPLVASRARPARSPTDVAPGATGRPPFPQPRVRLSQAPSVRAQGRVDGTSVQSTLRVVPSPLRPSTNPPNPWATTEVEYLEGGAPGASSRSTKTRRAASSRRTTAPTSASTGASTPTAAAFTPAPTATRAHARVPELRRRDGLRSQDRRQEARARAAARGVRRAEVAGREGRLQRGHRLLSAARGAATG